MQVSILGRPGVVLPQASACFVYDAAGSGVDVPAGLSDAVVRRSRERALANGSAFRACFFGKLRMLIKE